MLFLRNYVRELKQTGRPVSVLGRSSGGYLAKLLFDSEELHKAVYLAPVLQPEKRAELRPEFAKQQAHFFRNEDWPSEMRMCRWTALRRSNWTRQ